jgi:hypothetical protein
MQGLFGNLNNTLNNIGLSGNLGLLTTGVSLLEGQPIGQAVRSGLQTYQGLSSIDEERKRREAMANLADEYKNDPRLMQILKANPEAGLSLIARLEAEKRKPKATFSMLTPDEVKELGLPPGSVIQRNSISGDLDVLAKGAAPKAPETIIFGDKLLALNTDGTVKELMENTDKNFRTLKGDEIDIAKKALGLENSTTLGLFSVRGEGDNAEYKFSPLKSGGDTNVSVVSNANGEPSGIPNTDAIEDLNKKYSSDLLKWISNDSADSQKLILQLETVSKALAAGETNLSGPILNLIPDAVKAFTKTGQKAINTREAVEEVVQRNLKLILGGQFTEREGEKLVKRAFNPALDESENLLRVNRLLAQMQAAAGAKQAMADHFNKNGTLAGFDLNRIPTIDDFNLLLDTMDEQQLGESKEQQNQGSFAAKLSSANTTAELRNLSKTPGLTSDQLGEILDKLNKLFPPAASN